VASSGTAAGCERPCAWPCASASTGAARGLGTSAQRDPALVGELVETHGSERIVAAVDARDGRVAIEGWEQETGIAIEPGDILVCPYTDPAWTPLLGIAAGVVTETGGMLSHAAIVARERGIPAVLGIAGVMDRLSEGAVMTVDGTAGTVLPART
jgi:phosphoenolpyruvate synthase/pyruvate phosphate dikinase